MTYFLEQISQLWNRPIAKKSNLELPSSIYSNLDWKVSAIAGSYALNQFTKDTHWQPNDVDIMIACQDKNEFQLRCQLFSAASHARLIRENWFDKNDVRRRTWDDELFHDSVLGSKTYEFDGFDKKVQLICLQRTTEATTPAQILSLTSDIPACVSYTMFEGKKIFSIPEKGTEILLTRKGSQIDVCPNRLEKYTQRGYEFK